MNTVYLVNLLLILLSGFIMLAGFYQLLGLCCNGSKLSKLTGGFLGAVGLTGIFLTIVPTCF